MNKGEKHAAAVLLGALGGKAGGKRGGAARMAMLTPEQRSELARRAVTTRWARAKAKKRKAK
jgi:hypothetical protein